MARLLRLSAAVGAVAALALTATACTGSSNASNSPSSPTSGATGYPTNAPPVTITIWHGFSQKSEVDAFNADIKGFEALHPNIHVKSVANISDQQIINGIRGGNGPDVALSFTTDNVGLFCSSGAWIDLSGDLKSSGISMAGTFPAPLVSYTQFHGDQCALPMLNDAYGLYYNKAMFAAAHIAGPPKTLTEFNADVRKLTQYNADGSIKVAGFIPNPTFYESAPGHFTQTFGIGWQTADNKSTLAGDPAVAAYLNWELQVQNAEGGYTKLNKFQGGLGQEFSPQNAFETGKVAMEMDGEWRIANIQQDVPGLDYGVAPFPVADNRTADYGGGYVTGTIIGITRISKHQQAAWELVKYLTTDTNALVTLAKTLVNIPSTLASLQAAENADIPSQFKTMISISGNQNSATTPASPNGGNYQTVFQTWDAKWVAGSVSNMNSALSSLDSQIDAATKQSAG